jgi:hypothetical protein
MYQAGGMNTMQQRRQSFNDLTQALQSGDLASAQKAYSTLVQNTPGASNNPNSPLAQIGQALQSGDLAGAQSAMSSLKAARHGGHHHHHGNGGAAPTSAEIPPSTTSPGSVSSTLNTTA